MTRTIRFIFIALLVVNVGCSAGGGTREQLDRTTGTTWTMASEPAVFARTDPRFSRAARDYLYIGPVETNVRGLREYFLWVGVATTLDRGFLAPAGMEPTRLTFIVDGEPIDLELGAWQQVADGAGQVVAYATPVRTTLERGARVTRELLARVDAAAPGSVIVTTAPDGSVQYFAWRSWPDWSGFSTRDRAR